MTMPITGTHVRSAAFMSTANTTAPPIAMATRILIVEIDITGRGVGEERRPLAGASGLFIPEEESLRLPLFLSAPR